MTTETGEALSNSAIQDRIRKIIDGEDKSNPVSDEQIMKTLNAEGIPIKRRTVAKYRMALNIPSAIQRKI